MGKKKIVVDTNTLISAFGWEGKPHNIIRKILNEEIEMIISQQQIEEVKRVLDYPKFNFSDEQKSRFLSIVYGIANIVEISETLKIIEEDPDDNIILECAVKNKADFIISGDEHLLKLKEYSGVKIITASEFLENED